MYCCEFIQDFPEDKKGYYLYGEDAVIQHILAQYFPYAFEVTSEAELASAAPGYVIVPDYLIPEALGYVGLPVSDRTYLFITSGEKGLHDEVSKEFAKLKLPRVDCFNPSTPKPQRLLVEYIQRRINLKETLARKFAIDMGWNLGVIFNSLRLWESVVQGNSINDTKALKLLDILTPPQPYDEFIDNLMTLRFHNLASRTYKTLDPSVIVKSLSARVNSLRIYMEVYSSTKSFSTLVRDSGLSASEMKYYEDIRGKWTKKRLKYWSDIIVWVSTKLDKPQVLTALVLLLSYDQG